MPLHPAAGHEDLPAATTLTISCDRCSMRATSACADCIVTYICEREPDDSVVFDLAEQRAVRLLVQAGLVPTLRHRAAGL